MRSVAVIVVVFAFFTWDVAKNNGRYLKNLNNGVTGLAHSLHIPLRW
jgi:hypothetical protein